MSISALSFEFLWTHSQDFFLFTSCKWYEYKITNVYKIQTQGEREREREHVLACISRKTLWVCIGSKPVSNLSLCALQQRVKNS